MLEIRRHYSETLVINHGEGFKYDGGKIVFYDKKGKLYPISVPRKLILDITRPVSSLLGTRPDPKEGMVYIADYEERNRPERALYIPLSLIKHEIGETSIEKSRTSIETFTPLSIFAIEFDELDPYAYPATKIKTTSNDMIRLFSWQHIKYKPLYLKAKELEYDMKETLKNNYMVMDAYYLCEILQHYKITKRKKPLK